MNGSILMSSGNALLVAIPVVVCAVSYVFRLDELPTKIREDSSRPRLMWGTDEDGEPILSDPGGRVVRKRPPRKLLDMDDSAQSQAHRD
jgi:hypothetical protein